MVDFVNMALYFVYDGIRFLYGENATHCTLNSLNNGISTHFQFKCWFKKGLILMFLMSSSTQVVVESQVFDVKLYSSCGWILTFCYLYQVFDPTYP